MIRTALIVASLGIGSVALGAGLGAGCQGDEASAGRPPARSTGKSAGGPVLVELFTSQGCSSCPPAERLLPLLPSVAEGIEVIPLAFHVDYWDGGGWRDPFSSAAWTERQRRYAETVSDGRVYTPALVVQGSADVNGSDRIGALVAIRRAAAATPGGRIDAAITRRAADRLTVLVDASLVAGGRGAEAWVALTEDGLSTRVARGENAGRKLRGEHVVRRLAHAFALEAGGSRRADVELALDPAWKGERLGVVVFLQDPGDRRVLAAARARAR